jgi:predicted phage terminase large subunit-like protein
MVSLNSQRRLVRPIPISRHQQQFMESTAWLTGFVGGRNAGKTKIGCISIARRAKNGDPWMCISPDSNVIKETSFPSFLETVEYSGQYVSSVSTGVPKIVFRTCDNGIASIVFKGAEKPEKLRGPNKAGLWFDEASIISEDAFTIGIGMCRYKRKLSPVLATFTPRGFKHWSFEKFFERIDDSRIPDFEEGKLRYFNDKAFLPRNRTNLIHCATRNNPFAPTDYVEVIGGNYSSRLREQELEGMYLEISGLMFARGKFKYVEQAPMEAERIRYWDKASTPGDGCYSAGALIARTQRGEIFIEHIIRGQWSANERNKIMMQTAESDFRRYNGRVITYIEQEGAGSGKEVVDQLIVAMGKYPVYKDSATVSASTRNVGGVKLPGDAKIRRAYPLSAQVEAGNVSVVLAEWNSDFLDEICMFPEYRYADQADAVCAGYNKLANMAPDDLQSQRYTKSAEVGHYGRMVELSDTAMIDDSMDYMNYRNQPLPWNI